MKLKNINIILLAFTMFLAMLPSHEVQSQSVFDRFSKRYLKKNRVKKLGKRLSRTSKTPLENMGIRDGYEVIGFEPSWEIRKGSFENHYFNLLTTLVVGEYDINPNTGFARNREAFRLHLEKKVRDKTAKTELNILEKADYHNARIDILLQLTYYGDFGSKANQRAYLKNLMKDQQVQQTLSDSLNGYFLEIDENYNLTNDRTGILVDFQIENSNYNDDFVDFIKYLRTELGEQHLIYLKIPSKVRKNALVPFEVIQSLEPYVDRFIVQGYGFEKYTSTYSPLAIIDSTSTYSIDGTLKNYLLPGYEEVIKEKFIFELPYYGVIFKKDYQGQYGLKDGSPYITIDNFNNDVKGKSGTLKYMNDNTVAYFEEGDSMIYLVEDSLSLVSKFSYVADTLDLPGFAINALGYYSDPKERRAENWAVIADTFGEEREKLGWVIAMYLTAFLPIGFLYSIMKYWEVRNALAKFTNYWTRFRLFFLLFVLIFFVCTGIGGARVLLLILGLIIMAAFFLYIMVKKLMMRSKKYVNIVK